MLIASAPVLSPMVVARAKVAGPVCDSSQATVGHGSPLLVGSLWCVVKRCLLFQTKQIRYV